MIFSVVIPVYNVKDYLPKCIDSVLAQDFEDYEVILIDDGSPDRCGVLCDEFAARHPRNVRVIHKEVRGEIKACHAAFVRKGAEHVVRQVAVNAAERLRIGMRGHERLL